MSYIYKIENDINGKVYIGKTNTSIQERWKTHCSDAYDKRLVEKRPLYSAMFKYGFEHFHISEIEECSYEVVNEREKYWIEYYGSFKNGYNATLGGDGRAYLDYDLIYSTYKETKSIAETSRILGYHKDSISSILKNVFKIDENTILNNQRETMGKTVAMINKATNQIEKVFINTHEAGRFLGKTHQHIQEVCQGKRKSAYGYYWKYL